MSSTSKFLLAVAAIALVVLSFTLSSCGKINIGNNLANNLKYNLNMKTAEVKIVIPPYSGTNVNVTGSETNNYDIDSFIKATTGNAVGIANIESARLMECKLILEDASTNNNFANFSTCAGSFFSDVNSAPYALTIADNKDQYATELQLPVDSTINLKSYFENHARRFTYSLAGKLRRPTTDSIHCKVEFSFRITVKPII